MRSARMSPRRVSSRWISGMLRCSGIAEPADQRHYVESELMIRQGESRARPRADRGGGSGGRRDWAASDGQGQSEDAVESTDGAIVIEVGIGPVLAFGAVKKDRRQGQGPSGRRRGRCRRCAWADSSRGSISSFYAPGGLSEPLLPA